jgi:hypothetical protein
MIVHHSFYRYFFFEIHFLAVLFVFL